MGINIITEFKVKRGREDEVIQLLKKLLPESRKHAGEVIEEISIRQNQDDSNRHHIGAAVDVAQGV